MQITEAILITYKKFVAVKLFIVFRPLITSDIWLKCLSNPYFRYHGMLIPRNQQQVIGFLLAQKEKSWKKESRVAHIYFFQRKVILADVPKHVLRKRKNSTFFVITADFIYNASRNLFKFYRGKLNFWCYYILQKALVKFQTLPEMMWNAPQNVGLRPETSTIW